MLPTSTGYVATYTNGAENLENFPSLSQEYWEYVIEKKNTQRATGNALETFNRLFYMYTEMAGKMSAKIIGVNTGKEKRCYNHWN
jgi:hypothetical protein